MAQMTLSHCDCCGMLVDLARNESCPTCKYPVNPEKEQLFLETSLRDLKRVVRYGGYSLRVMDLVNRYEGRLQFLYHLKKSHASPTAPAIKQPEPAAQRAPAFPAGQNMTRPDGEPITRPLVRPVAHPAPVAPANPPAGPVQPVASMRGFTLSGDAMVNVLATLGGFLVLAGALSFLSVTSSLWLSFLLVLGLHAVFGGSGLCARRRFPQLRAVATLYTLIAALLVPLLTYSTYRLATNGLVPLPVPLLLALAAFYAAIIYTLLAIVQRFVPFAYLGSAALLVGDLALAQTLHLTLWWWPCVAMLLALAALIAVPGPSGAGKLFVEERAILRTPLLLLMYTVVSAAALLAIVMLSLSLSLDQQQQSLPEARLALFSLACLLLAWCALWIWRARRTRLTPLLAWLALGTTLLLGYVLNLNLTGYALLLAGMALLYHALVRGARGRLAAYGLPALTLDGLAIGLAALATLLVTAATPLQLLYRDYASFLAPDDLFLSVPHLLPFASGLETALDVLALSVCLLVTLDIALARAGFSRTPDKSGWCWLLLLSGFILTMAYGLEILFWNVHPLWAFLALTLGLIACAVLVRRFAGSAWARPLDLLTAFEIAFTLLLSLFHAWYIIGSLLFGLAILLYSVMLYQRRPLLAPITTILLLLALPVLLTQPILVLILSLLLPLTTAGMRRAGLFGRHPIVFAWTLLLPALIFGLVLAGSDINGKQSVFANWSGLPVSAAYEIAAPGAIWYGAALWARVKFWLAPATLFWLLALLLPSNNFWVLSALTPCLAVLAASIERRASAGWALPFYLVALFSAGMVVFTVLVSGHALAASWLLPGYALLAYGIGLYTNHRAALWLTPLFTTLAVFIAASRLGDLYQPPITALLCAGLGVIAGRVLPHRLPRATRDYSAPFYTGALAAAVLTGIYGMFGNINRPFYGALPDALFVYALVACVVLWIERRGRWNWLVTVFACWGVLLTRQLTATYMLGCGTGLVLLGLLNGQLSAHMLLRRRDERPRARAVFTWSWPWYVAFLGAALLLGNWPVGSILAANPVVPGMLAFTVLAVLVLLIERVPELLIFPAVLAAWTLNLWLANSSVASLIVAWTLLCALIFGAQFTWRWRPPLAHRPPETVHNTLSLGGLCLVLLFALRQSEFAPHDIALAQAGVFALVTLSALLFLSGLVHSATVARSLSLDMDETKRALLLERAHTVRHRCNYIAGLLLALAAPWELLAFQQTRLDVLTLVPASYLIVVAPFLLRDQSLPERRAIGQLVALAGSVLLFLPALWFSFNGANLLPTLILLVEALLLLALGLLLRMRIFILSSAALIIVGTLRLLFLSMPPSVPILLIAFGCLLMLLATALILARHRLQRAWRNWE